jgi:hypothetical protein
LNRDSPDRTLGESEIASARGNFARFEQRMMTGAFVMAVPETLNSCSPGVELTAHDPGKRSGDHARRGIALLGVT